MNGNLPNALPEPGEAGGLPGVVERLEHLALDVHGIDLRHRPRHHLREHPIVVVAFRDGGDADAEYLE
mgnify:CR=1 FL=1